MFLIFLLSHDSQSGEHSGLVMRLVERVLTGLLGSSPDPDLLEAVHLGLRKMAHMVEFGILYGLIRRAGPAPRKAFLLTVLYAAFDETHQCFVENRVGSLSDVGVDALGAALVVLWERRSRGGGGGGEPSQVPTRENCVGAGLEPAAPPLEPLAPPEFGG
jgi:VanZ family protein